MVHPAHTRIMQNGTGWYWEVVTYDQEVVARGIADTRSQARADASKAMPQETENVE
jgi:hypothetical protein